jgi:hypothetical protein
MVTERNGRAISPLPFVATQSDRGPYWRSAPHAGGDMAKKRTKSDKAQRQADGLEKKLERRPAQVPTKKAARE